METMPTVHTGGAQQEQQQSASVQVRLQKQLRAQATAAALLGRDVLPSTALLDTACGKHYTQLREDLLLQRASTQHSTHNNNPPTSLHHRPPFSMRTLADGLRAAHARRQHHMVEGYARLHLVPPAHQVSALVQLKQLELVDLQRRVRHDVLVERRVMQDCTPTTLLEWTHNTPFPNARSNLGIGATHRHNQSLTPMLFPPHPMDAPANRHAVHVALQARENHAKKTAHAAAAEKHIREQVEVLKKIRQLEEGVEVARGLMREQRVLREREHAHIQRIIQERQAFLVDVLNWQRTGFNGSQQNQLAMVKRREKRNKDVRMWHARELKRVAREEAARLAALRSNDYEAYLRLAQHTKDKRLRQLLDKTDDIIKELGLKVHQQKQDTKKAAKSAANGDVSQGNTSQDQPQDAPGQQQEENPREKENPQEEEDPEEEEAAVQQWLDGGNPTPSNGQQPGQTQGERRIAGQRNYYNMVHAIQEAVTQPLMLQGGVLRSYQLGGLRFFVSLYNNKINGILADEMGLGKTIQTIAYIAFLQEHKGNKGPHIVLAPKAVLHNWVREFAQWTPDTFRVVLYDGSPDERRALQKTYLDRNNFHVLVTNYELVMRDKAALRKIHWELLVVDEGHRLKNSESKLADILRSYTFKHRILLTGTPIQNSLHELWALLNFVLPKVFNSSQTFDDWFAAPFRGQGGDADAQQLNEEEQLLVINRLHQVIRPFMLRRTKREVEKELPNKIEHVIKCEMSAWQKAVYNQIARQGHVAMEGGGARGLQNAAMHLRKACNHPYLFLSTYEPHDPEELIRASGKLELLDRILPKLQATGHRVLLFSQMTRALDIIQDFLVLRGYAHLRLDGSVKAEDRGAMLEAFNAPGSEYFIFMLSTRAGGLGLNLQTADTVILFDSDWNPQADLQAEDRAHRIGQKRKVLVLVLVTAGTIEEEILDKAKQKREIDAKVIQAGMFNDHSTHEQRQAVLRAIMSRGAGAVADAVHDEGEVNEMLARTPEELERFIEMDEQWHAAHPGKSRLMTEEEVPSWVLQQEGGGEEEEGGGEGKRGGEDAGGRRLRKRRRTGGYADDAALLDALLASDENSGSDEWPQPTRRTRRRSGTSGGRQRGRRASSDVEEEEYDDSEDEVQGEGSDDDNDDDQENTQEENRVGESTRRRVLRHKTVSRGASVEESVEGSGERGTRRGRASRLGEGDDE